VKNPSYDFDGKSIGHFLIVPNCLLDQAVIDKPFYKLIKIDFKV
jgi:hypothetical protein